MRQIDRIEVLLEDMNGRIDTLTEVVFSMNERLIRVETIVERIPHIEAELLVMKQALKITNNQVQNHETRLIRLESNHAQAA